MRAEERTPQEVLLPTRRLRKSIQRCSVVTGKAPQKATRIRRTTSLRCTSSGEGSSKTLRWQHGFTSSLLTRDTPSPSSTSVYCTKMAAAFRKRLTQRRCYTSRRRRTAMPGRSSTLDAFTIAVKACQKMILKQRDCGFLRPSRARPRLRYLTRPARQPNLPPFL